MTIAAKPSVRTDAKPLDGFVRDVLRGAGADDPTVDAATRAMMHGSQFGIDSHGVRLLPHYVQVLKAGRVAPRPELTFVAELPAAAVLDAGNGHGALAAFTAMDKAIVLAERVGTGCVSIRNSSHFGAAGAYVLAAARRGMIGFATCNSDSFVRLHDGAERFHGTNPLAWGVPCGERPWFFDMATSAIPYNRILLHRSAGRRLPTGTASNFHGMDTDDPEAAEMLAPLGDAFGFKGAGLAGVAEIFSAVLSGMELSTALLPMGGPDLSTPRRLGAFVMAINPAAFITEAEFENAMARYLSQLRASAARDDAAVLAPGDREWAEADRRSLHGIPLDPETVSAFVELSRRYDVPFPPVLANGAA